MFIFTVLKKEGRKSEKKTKAIRKKTCVKTTLTHENRKTIYGTMRITPSLSVLLMKSRYPSQLTIIPLRKVPQSSFTPFLFAFTLFIKEENYLIFLSDILPPSLESSSKSLLSIIIPNLLYDFTVTLSFILYIVGGKRLY